jgi:hypothetical protein
VSSMMRWRCSEETRQLSRSDITRAAVAERVLKILITTRPWCSFSAAPTGAGRAWRPFLPGLFAQEQASDGCQLYPGSGGVHETVEPSSVAACRFATARSSSSHHHAVFRADGLDPRLHKQLRRHVRARVERHAGWIWMTARDQHP